ncbi:MAG: hypothetical protein V3V72_13580 [Ignavibacteriaceae bacterium]
MKRRNFIKNLAAIAVVSQIDITEAKSGDPIKVAANEFNEDGTPKICLTLQSGNEKIEINCSGLTLEMTPIINKYISSSWEPLDYKQDLIFTSKLTEKQHEFIDDAVESMYEKIQFAFHVDDLIYSGKGLLYDYEIDLATNECDVKLRINNCNVI